MASSGDDDSVLTEQQSQLQRIREQPAADTDSPPPAGDQEIAATSSDGAVRVLMRARRLVTVEIASGLLRRSRREASEVLREAINQALGPALADSPRAGDPAPNLAAIGDQLSDFARQSGEQLRKIQDAVEQNMAKVADKVPTGGDASPHYVDFVFEDALDVVRSMQSALADSPSEPVSGKGRDESHEVEAVVSQGELTELMLTSVALQMAPGELGAAVSETVNDALAEWEQGGAAAGQQGVDVEALRQLGERASAIRAQSMQHLRSYTDSMTSIMRNAE